MKHHVYYVTKLSAMCPPEIVGLHHSVS